MNFGLEGYRIGQVRLKRYLTKEELSEIIDISSIHNLGYAPKGAYD